MLFRKYEYIEDDIIKALDEGRNVYIESGAANDTIISYSFEYESIHNCCGEDYKKRIVMFSTTNCIFPKTVTLDNFNNVDITEFKGNLFIEVQ